MLVFPAVVSATSLIVIEKSAVGKVTVPGRRAMGLPSAEVCGESWSWELLRRQVPEATQQVSCVAASDLSSPA